MIAAMSVSAGDFFVCDCTWEKHMHTWCVFLQHEKQQASGWASRVTQKTAASVSVSVWLTLIPRLFGTCGQVNETQWEGTFPWFPPCQEAVGDGMRFSNSLPFSLCGPPLHQQDSLIPSLGTKVLPPAHLSFSVTYCWLLPSQLIFFWSDNLFHFVYSWRSINVKFWRYSLNGEHCPKYLQISHPRWGDLLRFHDVSLKNEKKQMYL